MAETNKPKMKMTKIMGSEGVCSHRTYIPKHTATSRLKLERYPRQRREDHMSRPFSESSWPDIFEYDHRGLGLTPSRLGKMMLRHSTKINNGKKKKKKKKSC